jgi:hypothetical protein
LAKEARARRHEQCTSNLFITTGTQVDGVDTIEHLNPSTNIVSLVVSIELSDSENLLAVARF